MSEQQIEQEIQAKGLNAPRVTPALIDSKIKEKTFTILPNKRTMICQLTLENGFTVEGQSAVVDVANFNQEIGEKISFENARDQIWQLEGYLLKEQLYHFKIVQDTIMKSVEDNILHDLNKDSI